MPDNVVCPIALMSRLKIMVAHDSFGRTPDGSDRPELTVPPHHAFRRVWRSRRGKAFLAPPQWCPPPSSLGPLEKSPPPRGRPDPPSPHATQPSLPPRGLGVHLTQ